MNAEDWPQIDPDKVPTRRVDLEKIRFSTRFEIPDTVPIAAPSSLEFERWYDHARNIAIEEITATVLGQTHQVAEWRSPASWWEHVKERFFPPWLRRRFPVRYDVRRVEAHALLPSLDLKVPGHRTTIVLMGPLPPARPMVEP